MRARSSGRTTHMAGQVVGQPPRAQGGLGPHRAFALKNTKLDPNSPWPRIDLCAETKIRGRGGEEFSRTKCGPVGAQHASFRQFPESFFRGGVVKSPEDPEADRAPVGIFRCEIAE